MNVLQRVWQTVQERLNPTEEPAVLLAQVVTRMHQDLIQLRQATAQAIATQKRTERRLNEHQNTADQWHQRAHRAIAQGDELLAKDALKHRHEQLEQVKWLRTQMTEQNQVITKLKQDLRHHEQQYSRAKLKKEIYLARLQSAQATQNLQTWLNDSGNSPWDVFDRVEAQIFDLEAQAEVAQLPTLERQFAALEQPAAEAKPAPPPPQNPSES